MAGKRGAGKREELEEKGISWKFLILIAAIILAVIGIALFLNSFEKKFDRINGKVSLDLGTSILSGNLIIKMKTGEFLPYGTQIIVSQNGKEQSFYIGDFIENSSEGSYYVENANLQGNGMGFGFAGGKKIYPQINFVFKLVDEGESDESGEEFSGEVEAIEEGGVSEENLSESVEETAEAGEELSDGETEALAEVEPDALAEEEAQTNPGDLTGNAVIEEEVSGIVSKDSRFTYNVEDKQIGIISVDRGSISDLNIAVENGVAIISTEYYEIETGYGEEFLSGEVNDLEIELGKLNVEATEGILIVKLVYNEIVLAEISKKVSSENLSEVVKPLLSPLNESWQSEIQEDVSTKQHRAVIGRQVKWVKKVSVSKQDQGFANPISIEIPKSAENISVKTGADAVSAEMEAENSGAEVEMTDKKELLKGMTGEVSLDIELKEKPGLIEKFWNWIKSVIISGNIVLEQDLEKISETENNKVVDVGEIAAETGESEIAVEYYTEAPNAVESEISGGKRVVVSGPDSVHYEDVLAFSELEKETEKQNIKLYWVVGENRQEVSFDAYDLNENGLIDYVEWNVPSLSNQTYEIIYITKAVHLDSNRNLIGDIYSQVSALDGEWFSNLSAGEYVRVTFEKTLTNKKDITLYARGIGGEIGVYRESGDEEVARFENVSSEGWYKIYLTNLNESESYDVFDLKLLSGSVEIDYIVDPSANDTSNNIYQCGTLDSPGTYTLNQSVTALGGSECLKVNSAHVSINCVNYGRYISATAQTYGIYSNYTNTTIQNCNITAGSSGYSIYLDSANNSYIYGNQLNTPYAGIGMASSYYGRISTNTMNNNLGVYAITGQTSFNNFSSNTITAITSGGTPYGIYIIGNNNTFTSNNIIANGTSSSDAIGIYVQGNGSTIYSNTLSNGYTSLSTYYGVKIAGNDNNVTNSDGSNNYGSSSVYGVHITGDRNYISGSEIYPAYTSSSTSGVYGVYISGNSNTITGESYSAYINSSTFYGIYVSGNNNNLSNNYLGPYDTYYPVHTTWYGNYISGNGNNIVPSSSDSYYVNYAHYLDGDSNILSRANPSSVNYSVYISGNNNNVSDSNLASGNLYDVYVNDGTGNLLLNASYDLNQESVQAGGNLTRKWYYAARTNTSSGIAVSGANVTGFNVSGTYAFNLTTNASGWTPLGQITEYTNIGGTKSYYSNYTIYATNSSYGTMSKSLNASTNNYAHVFTFDATIPLISFNGGSETNGDVASVLGGIYLNVSVTEASEDTISFFLFNSTRGLVNSTLSTSRARSVNWTGFADGTYYYNVTVNDTSGNKNSTDTRMVKLVSTCLNSSRCAEGGNCVVNQSCYLYSGLCSGSICDFGNFTINSSLYTLYDSANRGNNLFLNISEKITFLRGNNIVFSGKNASQGGNGGYLNITTVYPNLFNTTRANFTGKGGSTTTAGLAGGNGGVLTLNYWGLIRNFTDSEMDVEPALPSNVPVLTAGLNGNGFSEDNGRIVYNRDNLTLIKDVDVNGDGEITLADVGLIRNRYNNISTDAGFSALYDVNGDNIINVIDLARIGLEYLTR